MRVAIVVFPGSNCDRDIFEAIKSISKKLPKFIWHKETNIENFDLIVIPGGFTFGDYLRCGALASNSPVIKSIRDHASRGGAILGICNGFQILTEAKLLPGTLIKNSVYRIHSILNGNDQSKNMDITQLLNVIDRKKNMRPARQIYIYFCF